MKYIILSIFMIGILQTTQSQDLSKCNAFKLTSPGSYYTYDYRATAFYVDKADNYYVGTYNTRSGIGCTYYNGCEFMILNKYSNQGQLQWSFDMQDFINHNVVWYSSSYINGIVTDDSGYVYVAATCAGGKIQLGNIQLGDDVYSNLTKFLVFKLNPQNLKVVWAIYGNNTEPSSAGGIIMKDGSLFVSYWKYYTEQLTMTASNGSYDMKGDMGIVEISSKGLVQNSYPLQFSAYPKKSAGLLLVT